MAISAVVTGTLDYPCPVTRTRGGNGIGYVYAHVPGVPTYLLAVEEPLPAGLRVTVYQPGEEPQP